jgi:hypothetical protein
MDMDIEEIIDALDKAHDALLGARQWQAALQRELPDVEFSFHDAVYDIANYFAEGEKECPQKLIDKAVISRQKLKEQRENLVRFEKEVAIAEYGYNKAMIEILYYLADKDIIL